MKDQISYFFTFIPMLQSINLVPISRVTQNISAEKIKTSTCMTYWTHSLVWKQKVFSCPTYSKITIIFLL